MKKGPEPIGWGSFFSTILQSKLDIFKENAYTENVK